MVGIGRGVFSWVLRGYKSFGAGRFARGWRRFGIWRMPASLGLLDFTLTPALPGYNSQWTPVTVSGGVLRGLSMAAKRGFAVAGRDINWFTVERWPSLIPNGARAATPTRRGEPEAESQQQPSVCRYMRCNLFTRTLVPYTQLPAVFMYGT